MSPFAAIRSSTCATTMLPPLNRASATAAGIAALALSEPSSPITIVLNT